MNWFVASDSTVVKDGRDVYGPFTSFREASAFKIAESLRMAYYYKLHATDVRAARILILI